MHLDPQVSTALYSVLAAAIVALGGWALSILERKLGIDKNDRAQKAFENVITNGIALGSKAVAERLAQGEEISPAQRTAVVASTALDYAADKVAPEMKRLDIKPETLPDRVIARVARTPPGSDEKAVTEKLNADQLH